MASWHVYMIRCGKGTLYTGITTDVKRRFAEHQSSGPRAARYLKGRKPLRLVFTVDAGDRAAALRLERWIKGLPKEKKELLIQCPDSLRRIVDPLRGDRYESCVGPHRCIRDWKPGRIS